MKKELPKLEYYVRSQDGNSSLFYRLDKDLGELKIPVVFITVSEIEEKIYPTMEWLELNLGEGSTTEIEFDKSSFLLEYSKVNPLQ